MFSFFLILSLCTSSQSLLFGTKFNAHLLLDRPRHRLCTSRRCVGDYRGKDNSQPLLHTQLQNEDILNGSAPPIKDAYNQIEEDMFLHSKADFVRSNSDRANVLSFLSQYKDSFSYLIPILLLILQNSGLILFMRYSIIRSKRRMYIVSTAVFCSELIKFTLSVLLSYSQDVQRSFSSFRDLLYLECVTKKDEFFKIIIPSILYSLQNNLQYVAVANLSAPVFQTMYQMKIVSILDLLFSPSSVRNFMKRRLK